MRTSTIDNELSSLRGRLKQIADGYQDSLAPATRARLVSAARKATASSWYWSSPFMPFMQGLPRAVAVAAVLVVLALPALQMRQQSNAPHSGIRSSINDLQVTERDGQVVLTWKDGDQPRRVVRATNRQDLAHMSQLPGETVRGERYVDPRPSDAEVVYYLVE